MGIDESDLLKLHRLCLTYESAKDFRIKEAIREIGKPKPLPNVQEEVESTDSEIASGTNERYDKDASERPGTSVQKRGITWSLEDNRVQIIPPRAPRVQFTERRNGAYENKVIRMMNSMALEERRRLVATHVLSRGKVFLFLSLIKTQMFVYPYIFM